MEIKLSATTRIAPAPVDKTSPSAFLPSAINDEQIYVKLNMPLRPTRPMNEYLNMTAMERTMWEIRSRSEAALHAQTVSLDGSDVEALLTG